jgi:UDP-glucose 4-epimerase
MNKLDGKVILVTGANGFIGAHLVARLSKIAGIKLLLLSRQQRQSIQQNMVWLKSELAQLTPGYWNRHGISHIDYVFHLGAFTPKIGSEVNRINSAIEDNILGTHALLESLPGKIKKIVFSSTLDVYAQSEYGDLLTENARIAPSSLYGSSKLFCESLVDVWAKKRSCGYALLRYGHIYGPGEEKYEKLIPVVIRNLLSNKAPVVHGDGSALRDFLYVGDAVEATIRAALIDDNLGPVNIVRGESISLKNIVNLLIHLFGDNKKIHYLTGKPNGNSFRFDNDMMIKLLGNWTKFSLEEGLVAEIDAFRRTTDE